MRALVIPCIAVTVLTVTTPGFASLQESNSTLGFESTGDWTASGGTIIGTSSTRTQGSASLSVHASGYTTLKSRLLGPLGQVFQSVTFDLGLPSANPTGWAGAVQLFVSIPSLAVNNAYVGQVDLTGLKAGQFNKIKLAFADDLLQKLRSSYSDLSFTIALNVPTNSSSIYLLDNFEVSSTIPPYGSVGPADAIAILGFEVSNPAWTLTSGTYLGLSTVPTGRQGKFSLAIAPHGYSTLTSPPLPSIGPVASTISFDLWQPALNPAPSTYGAAQLFVSIPSQNVSNAYLGQLDLNSVPRGAFSTLTFPVPADLVSKLNAPYTDLRFMVALNVPINTAATYYVDNFRTGAITTPPSPLPGTTPAHPDLVGLANSGVATLTVDADSVSANVKEGSFYVEEGDKSCVPTATQGCRYIVHLVKLRTGPVAIFGKTQPGFTLFNLVPFELMLGGAGSASLSGKVPANVPFSVSVDDPKGFSQDVTPNDSTTMTISPAGNGLIAFSSQFQSTVNGHAVALNVAVTANSPLVNRPPLANAGPDQTISSSYCVGKVQLNGTGSSDPDGNTRTLEWFDGDALVGVGATPTVSIRSPGTHVLTLVATDVFGSQSRDQVSVNAQIPDSCPVHPH